MHKLIRFVLIVVLFSFNGAFAGDIFDHIETQDSLVKEDPIDIFASVNENEVSYFKKAKIIIMNKITANSKEFQLNVGSKVNYGKAELQLHKCAISHNSNDGYSLLVTLKERSFNDDIKLVFSGWIFSKNLSLSAVEHPIHQLIAVSCS